MMARHIVNGKYEFSTTKPVCFDGYYVDVQIKICWCIISKTVVNEQAFYKDSINDCSDLADSCVNAIGKKIT